MTERTVVKKVKNGILYSDGTMRIDAVRFSYPHIGTAYESTGDDGNTKKQFSVTAMLPKATHKEAKDLIKSCIQELLKASSKDPNTPVKVPSENWCLLDGTVQADGDDKKEVYRDHFIVKAAESRRPTARDRKGEVIMDETKADDVFFGGVWGNILIRLWYFDGKAKNGKTYPKRVLANLIAVQHHHDDEPFGESRVSDEGVFDAVEGDDNDGFEDDGEL